MLTNLVIQNQESQTFDKEAFESKIYISANPTNPSDYGYKVDDDNFFGEDFNQALGIPNYIKLTPFDLDRFQRTNYDEMLLSQYERVGKNDPTGYLKQAWNLFEQILGEDFNPNGNGYITKEQYRHLPKGIELKGSIYDGIATIYGDSDSAKIGKEDDLNLLLEFKSNGFVEIFSNERLEKISEDEFVSIDALFYEFVYHSLWSAEVEYPVDNGFCLVKDRTQRARDYHKDNQTEEIKFVGINNLDKIKPLQQNDSQVAVSGDSLLLSVLSEISKAKQNLLSNAHAQGEDMIYKNSL